MRMMTALFDNHCNDDKAGNNNVKISTGTAAIMA